MRALGFEPKKEEIKKMISDIDKDGSGKSFALRKFHRNKTSHGNLIKFSLIKHFEFFFKLVK